ncbi:MAG: FAD-dependent monooxygenase [Burkholderiales bacterium]|nr:FAD-dependent monooxygenase [Burkholderiales bacterium]MDE2274971.1 FAD-dependent monooxygenase [Burkholderiales bacterium]
MSPVSRGPRRQFDAVIVGAGPAGSTAAILLARAGLAVALVERHAFPRRKVCGGCVAASNLPLLATLGVAEAFEAGAGPQLRHVSLHQGSRAVSAPLPAAAHPHYRWGRALGRETLDALLLERARAAGAWIFQPWSVQAILGTTGAWHCELRAAGPAALLRLRTPVVIDAHGGWEGLPSEGLRPRRPAPPRAAGDLFAFNAQFSGSALHPGTIGVLALEGGYGGMVVADGGLTTVACCIRRDRLGALRSAAPGLSAGDAVQAWLQRECLGVREALQGARRAGAWLGAGPLVPGVHLAAGDTWLRIGQAAGEAHPILGEGMSMALQSAALLCSHLLAQQPAAPAELQRQYAADWQRQFRPRLRLAAAFAHAAMRPRGTALLMALAGRWPGLLTQGARWGGKVQAPAFAPADPAPLPIDRRGAPRKETP